MVEKERIKVENLEVEVEELVIELDRLKKERFKKKILLRKMDLPKYFGVAYNTLEAIINRDYTFPKPVSKGGRYFYRQVDLENWMLLTNFSIKNKNIKMKGNFEIEKIEKVEKLRARIIELKSEIKKAEAENEEIEFKNKEFLNRMEVSKYFGVSYNTMKEIIEEEINFPKPMKHGKSLLFNRIDLENWMIYS